MYRITLNQKSQSGNSARVYEVEFTGGSDKKGFVNGRAFNLDIIAIGNRRFHIIKDRRSYTAEIEKADFTAKNFVILVNGKKHRLEIKDRFDELIQTLGLNRSAEPKAGEIKAPMPGLVLDIMVKQGDRVKKEDPVLILEAMKMENVLKTPEAGIVKMLKVRIGEAVEKNQVLVCME